MLKFCSDIYRKSIVTFDVAEVGVHVNINKPAAAVFDVSKTV